MKNNLLEINFLQNVIEKCNQRISELRNEIKNGIKNGQYKNKQLQHAILRQQISSFIKKREEAKKTFDTLLEIK